MGLSLVFPMFWGREKTRIYEEGDYFYDHPTAIDDEGTIPPLFESLSVLKDRDFDVIAIAGANNPAMEAQVEIAASSLLGRYAEQAEVTLHFFSYSHLKRLQAYLEDIGRSDLSSTLSLQGYSPLRNACLVAAHILGREIAVSIDDDCLFIDPLYIERIKGRIGSIFEDRPILAYGGPYLTEKGSIYLDPPARPYTAYWNVIQHMNETFRRYIVDTPGLKEVSFAIMGNIAVHRDFFSRIPLDPPMQRGEDMDWVMNSHIFGERFIMDTDSVIKHAPPPRPYPTWRPLREDIYRFRYQRAKIEGSRDGEGIHKLSRDRYLPYPGAFFQDDFVERASRASSILSMEYLSEGQPENAAQALNNVLHAHVLAEPKGNPFETYLTFQKQWQELMTLIDHKRADVQRAVFG